MKTERMPYSAFQTASSRSFAGWRMSYCSFWVCLVAGLVSSLLVSAPLQAQDVKTGLTGEAHAADLVQARQMLMDAVEEQMMAIEIALAGKEPKIVELQNRAYQMNILFSAFPHLFAPQTQPPKGNDDPGYQTNALPKIWQNFEVFYDVVQNAAGVSLAASQAKDMPNFKDQIQILRKGCDSCHAEFMTPVTDPHGP
jgi:cytochrome c556